jgi:hypothetical protein
MPLFDVEAVVQEELLAGRMTVDESVDVVEQHGLFELNRAELESAHQGEWAGFVAGALLLADSQGDLLSQAEQVAPDSLMYYEQLPPIEEE